MYKWMAEKKTWHKKLQFGIIVPYILAQLCQNMAENKPILLFLAKLENAALELYQTLFFNMILPILCQCYDNFFWFSQPKSYIAKCKNPKKAVKLDMDICRNLGIGNSTGLGMAPFIVNHPTLLNKWVLSREIALKKIREIKKIKIS